MAGRYVFTPARRAALKKAAAKSAAKRRKNRANRKAYRSANRAAARQISDKFAKGGYTKPGLKGVGDALTGGPRRRAMHDYDKARNRNAVKYRGKKKLTDKQIRRRRRAKSAAGAAAGLALHMGANYAAYRANESEYEKQARRTRKKARQTQKARKKQYNQDKKQSLKARKRNLAAAGLNRHGESKRRRKPVKVTSQRLPGQAMIGSGRR